MRKISVDQLTVGMFVHEICGAWMDHPFWSTKFLVRKVGDLVSIRNSPIQEVWIDTERGLDIKDTTGASEPESESERDERLDRELVEAMTTKAASRARVDLRMEVRRAAGLCVKSRAAVASMFKAARMGHIATPQALNCQRHPKITQFGNLNFPTRLRFVVV